MQIGPTEQARLTIFLAAELARRTRREGLLLNAPEAIAIACDEMHLAARRGGSFEDVLGAGRRAVAPGELLDGVADLIGEIKVEVLLEEGTRLVVLRGLGAGDPSVGPGAADLAFEPLTINATLASFDLDVTNTSDVPVRISSHFPFDRVNPRMTFDRQAAVDARLDIPAGDTVRWAPGETRRVRLVRIHDEAGTA